MPGTEHCVAEAQGVGLSYRNDFHMFWNNILISMFWNNIAWSFGSNGFWGRVDIWIYRWLQFCREEKMRDEAKAKGARALFEAKYLDSVRVLTIGSDNFSIELCGGTHLRNSSNAKSFALVEESAISKGVRRVVCFTGEAALQASLPFSTSRRRGGRNSLL